MAIKTSALVPFPITAVPDRYTPLYVADKTLTTDSYHVGLGPTAAKQVIRVQSAMFGMGTNVTEVEEMGSLSRVGGVDDLGEAKWKVDTEVVGLTGLATLCGVPINTASGATTTIGLTQIQNAQVDFFRMAGDSYGNIYQSLYLQDCIIDDVTIDVKEKGTITQSLSGRGPNAVAFPGFFVPVTYVATSNDVSNGYLNVGSIIGGDESPVEIYLPPSPLGTPVAPTVAPTTGTGTLPAGSYNYVVVARNAYGNSFASPVSAASVLTLTGENTLTITALTGALSYDVYVVSGANGYGFLGNTSALTFVDNGSATPNGQSPPPQNTSGAAPSYWQQNGSQYFLKIEKIPGANLSNPPVRYYENNALDPHVATYNHSTEHLSFSDAFAAGDLFRLVFCSYNTDSFPLTVSATPIDNSDRVAIPSRLCPVKISTTQLKRVKSASIKFALKREHANGVGENSIIYGPSAVPDVTISLDVDETDTSLLDLLQNATTQNTSGTGTIANDFLDLNYVTRSQLDPSKAIPFSVSVFDPFSVGTTLVTFAVPQMVVKNIDFNSSNKAVNTVKVDALDIQGVMTAAFTHP